MTTDLDNPIARAAGYILFMLDRDMSPDEAKAAAWEREIELTQAEIDTAMDWASRSLAFTDRLNTMMQGCENGCKLTDDPPETGEVGKMMATDVTELAAKYVNGSEV